MPDQQRKQCLILGPMSDATDKRKMLTLQKMLQTVFTTLRKDYEVINPYSGKNMKAGYIPDNVLREIDRAELVIINITGIKPNVLYETALCHALGIPCILITENSGEVPFYLHDIICETINFNRIAASTTILTEHIVNIDENNNRQEYLKNPVTKFFTRPILDISPAIGVAQGYYNNLLSHIRETLGDVNADGKWEHELKIYDHEKKDFVEFPQDQRHQLKYRVIIPTDIKFTSHSEVTKVNSYKDCVRGQTILHYRKANNSGKNETRIFGITFHRIDNDRYELIDVPTPMNAINVSLDKRMRESIRPINKKYYEDKEINRFQNEMETLMAEYDVIAERQNIRARFKNKIEVIRFDIREEADELRAKNLLWVRRALEDEQ